MTEYQQSAQRCVEIVTGKVCGGCGGELTPIETVDNAHRPTFWPGCGSCSRFDYGVPPEVFRIARALVEEGAVTPYTYDYMQKYRDSKIEDERRYWVAAQTHGAVSIVRRVLALSADAAKLAKVQQLAERWKLEVGSGSISPHAEQVLAILQGDSHE